MLRLLEGQENDRDEARQQLKAKLERGAAQAAAGELLDGDEVFDELREIIDERRQAKTSEKSFRDIAEDSPDAADRMRSEFYEAFNTLGRFSGSASS